MWNPFKRKNNKDPQDLNFLQRMALKRFERMNPEEKQKIANEMMKPENIAKNKDKIEKAIQMMKASGQINEQQAQEARKRLGL